VFETIPTVLAPFPLYSGKKVISAVLKLVIGNRPLLNMSGKAKVRRPPPGGVLSDSELPGPILTFSNSDVWISLYSRAIGPNTNSWRTVGGKCTTSYMHCSVCLLNRGRECAGAGLCVGRGAVGAGGGLRREQYHRARR
jgi:hypothetical protein